MIKYLQILEEIYRPMSTLFNFGLPVLDQVIGQMRPGIYGLIGPGKYPLHLGLQCLQSNDDVCLYYGYVYPPLTAMQRLSAYGLKIPLAQIIVDPRNTLTRNSGFSSFRLRMRFMNFIDMYQVLPPPPISIGRLISDIGQVREKEDQLVVICLDDFSAWLRSLLGALDAKSADPARLAHSLQDFCQIYQTILITPCQSDDPMADILRDISIATLTLTPHEATDPQGSKLPFTLTYRDAISESPLEINYSKEMESFS
ncbi:MAG: hypothetical protein ACYC6A_24395 [Armatimonadota bacterium]